MRIEELLEGVQSELAIKIYGEDQKAITQISKDIQNALDGLEEIEIEPQLGQANIIITPNYQALARYGIRVDEIMQLVRNGIGEEPITQKIEGVKRFGVVANQRIKEGVTLPSGYYIEWAGDFKNMQEATERLMMIIPITILLILLLLYTAFNSIKKALLVLMNVPFGLAFGFACRVFLGL